MLKVIFVLTAALTLLFCTVAIATGFATDLPRLLQLQQAHAEVVGKVVHVLPASHGLVEIIYVVDGVTHTFTTAPHLPGGPIIEGSSVRVYYSPKDPSVVVAAPPSDILTEELQSSVVVCLFIALGTAIVLLVWMRNKDSG